MSIILALGRKTEFHWNYNVAIAIVTACTVLGSENASAFPTTAGDALYNGTPVVVDPMLVLPDEIRTQTAIQGATAYIEEAWDADEDVLGCTSTASIACTYDAARGLLRIEGTASGADYQALLRTVTYNHSGELTPLSASTRSIRFTVAGEDYPQPFSGGVYLPATGHLYGEVLEPVTSQLGARLACQIRGARLVTIIEVEEQALVQQLSQGPTWLNAEGVVKTGTISDWAWRDEQDGEFWRDGDASGMPVAGFYANWAVGEPNVAPEDVTLGLQMNTDGTWAAESQSAQNVTGFVCEHAGVNNLPVGDISGARGITLQLPCPDADSDGFEDASCGGDDCNDADNSVHPDASEVCDDANTDEDCDGEVNDDDSSVDPASQSTWYADEDGDGYGNPSDTIKACAMPAGYAGASSTCGDGIINTDGVTTEACDDGGRQDGDGCSASCAIEEASTCESDNECATGYCDLTESICSEQPSGGGGCAAANAPSGQMPWFLIGFFALIALLRRTASTNRQN